MNDKNPLATLPSWMLTRAAARSHRILQGRLRDAGFTGYEYRVMATLAIHGRQSQADVGRSVSLDRRDVTHTVRQLEERGLVDRTRDTADDRLVLAQLSPAGRREWVHLEEAMLEAQDELLAPLAPDEARQFVALLARLAGDL